MASQQFMDGGDGNTSYRSPKPTKEKDTEERRGKSDNSDPVQPSMPTLPPSGSFEETLPDDGSNAANITVLSKGGMVVDRDGNITMPDKDGKPVTKTRAEVDKEMKALLEGKQDSWLGPTLAAIGGAGLGTVLGGPTSGAAGASLAAALYKKVAGSTPEEKKANAEKEWQALLDKNGGDVTRAIAELKGGEATASSPTKDTTSAPPMPSPVFRSGKGEVVSNIDQAAGGPLPQPAKTEEQKAREAVLAAQTAEQKRFDDLVKLYAPNAKGFSPLDITTATTPKEAEAVKKTNDLIALSAKSGAIGDKARSDLSALTKMTPDNRDAWLQYYNPAATVSSAASASGATASAAQGQATLASMAPTEVGEVAQATGQYQTDLSPLTSYDSAIARSDQRARSVGLADMMEARARGEVPSVAAEQYKVGLDRLLQAQQAATASQRGPASALALRGAQTQAGQLGQQAVRETAILRLQEQKEAEERAAAQSNLIMIEDQKLASQEKVNELNQRIQIVSADLQNTKNLLDRDMFNAEAMNKVNMLEAQLRTDIESLNAELGTRASLTNAELATRASIASADNATSASIASARNATDSSIANAGVAASMQRWAGDSAQASLRDQIATERADWTRGYTVSRDSLSDQMAATRDASLLMSGLGTNDISRARLDADIAKNEADRRALNDAANARERESYIASLLEIYKASQA